MSAVLKLMKVDLIKLMNLKRYMVIFLLAPVVLTFFGPQMLPLGYVISVYGLIYGQSAYDEQSRAGYFYGTIPVSRGQVVLSRYLYSVVVIVGISLLELIIIPLSIRLMNNGVALQTMTQALVSSILLSVVFVSVTVPIVLMLGVTKSRFVIFGIYFVLIFIAQGLMFLPQQLSPLFASALKSPLVLTVASLLLLFLSYLVCDSLYKKKEYTD